MDVPKALLIQDVSEYIYVLKNAMQPFLRSFDGAGFRTETVLEWIIKEELELVYHLFPTDHHRYPEMDRIYAHVKNHFNGTLSLFTSEYIKAPLLFTENRSISIKLVRGDLYLWYYRQSHSPYFLTHLRT